MIGDVPIAELPKAANVNKPTKSYIVTVMRSRYARLAATCDRGTAPAGQPAAGSELADELAIGIELSNPIYARTNYIS
jgi:hypothetical protein